MSEPTADDDRFDEIIADYLDAVSSGLGPDEEKLLAENPEFSAQLQKFFADHRRMGGLLDSNAEDTAAPSGKTRGDGDAPTIANLDAPMRFDVDPDKCIADYLLMDKIAEGGMGVVFKAKQLSLNRTVALKMIRAGEFADTEEIKRFRIEAEAAARLNHPGIVPIYQIGEDKGQHFFSMALIEGQSLADMIREERMKPRRAAEYVTKVARAVHYAHEQGIIHRDIKPANVLVDQNDEPMVTDFGLAKQITGNHELTMSGQILGTASYMPPEQASGHEITPLADVYSIGALLYTLLTKQPPFTGSNPVDILMDVLSKDPATPSSLNITLSRDLETICMRCLDKDPNRRYASAAALADDLDRFLDGVPILARRIGKIEKYIRWCRRNPAVAATVFLSILSLVIVPAAYVSYRSETTRYIVPETIATRLLPLVRIARQKYAVVEPTVESERDRVLVLAGKAMLAYEDKGPAWENDSFPASEALFRNAAIELERLLIEQPEDASYQSALADCLMQLAEFRIAKSRYLAFLQKPADRVAKYRQQRVVVAKEDEEEVARCLNRSLELLTGLLQDHPESKVLKMRTATARMAMRSLPGEEWPHSFEERMQQVADAGKLSEKLELPQGLVRFEFEPSLTGKITVDEDDGAKELVLSTRLEAANGMFEEERYVDALDGYREALALKASVEEAPLPLIQSAFRDLAVLSVDRPDAVKFIVEKNWPVSAEAYYHAILGIRSAVAE